MSIQIDGGPGNRIRNIIRPLHLVANLFRDAERRHSALGYLAPPVHRLIWRGRLRRLRKAHRNRQAILIGLVEHLGDIVAAEPVSRYLRSIYPDAYLVWAVREPYLELIESNPHIDAALVVGCLTQWIGLADDNPFDRVVDLQLPGRSCGRCHVTFNRTIEPGGITLHNYYDHGNLLRIFCKAAGLPALDAAPRVYIPDAVRRRVDALALPENFVAIHCTSNQSTRDWSSRKWNSFVGALTGQGVAVVEIGLQRAVDSDSRLYQHLCGELSILETGEVIRRARLFVGVDSGPAHLANAAGTLGVVLLGQYAGFSRRMPFSGGYEDGSNATVVYGNGPAAEIPVDDVLGAALARLNSSPTGV